MADAIDVVKAAQRVADAIHRHRSSRLQHVPIETTVKFPFSAHLECRFIRPRLSKRLQFLGIHRLRAAEKPGEIAKPRVTAVHRPWTERRQIWLEDPLQRAIPLAGGDLEGHLIGLMTVEPNGQLETLARFTGVDADRGLGRAIEPRWSEVHQPSRKMSS